jgi:UPF0176 protein
MQHIANFYHFFEFNLIPSVKEKLYAKGKDLSIKGTILLACEGINAAIAGSEKGLKDYIEFIHELLPPTKEAIVKLSISDKNTFRRFKVALKKEIVTLKTPHILPHNRMGNLVDPKDWDNLIKDPETIVIDTRNDYEIKVGSFPGAVNPQTKTFSDFVNYVHENKDKLNSKKIAMYCTGGIRCEKASAYLLQENILDEVYQLKGGILNYFEQVSPDQSSWQGDLFLFDDRCAVDKTLSPKDYFFCRSCGDIALTNLGIKHATKPGLECPDCQNKKSQKT